MKREAPGAASRYSGVGMGGLISGAPDAAFSLVPVKDGVLWTMDALMER